MKRLSEAVQLFQEASARHDQLKDAFLHPEEDVNSLDARETYFACQPAYESARQEFLQFVRGLHRRGRLIDEYERLTVDLRVVTLRVHLLPHPGRHADQLPARPPAHAIRMSSGCSNT